MIDQRFEQNGRAGLVDRSVALDRIHRLPDPDLGGEMDDTVDALQRAGDNVLVADVADDQLGFIGKVVRLFAIAVDLLDQAIEHSDPIAAPKKLTRD